MTIIHLNLFIDIGGGLIGIRIKHELSIFIRNDKYYYNMQNKFIIFRKFNELKNVISTPTEQKYYFQIWGVTHTFFMLISCMHLIVQPLDFAGKQQKQFRTNDKNLIDMNNINSIAKKQQTKGFMNIT
ncbi:hypothetical protein ACJX0J_015561 [Zea mays]